MKCRGNFVYKGIEEKQGGEFTNDKGQTIKYDGSYSLKVDEVTESGVNEIRLKIPLTNKALFDKLKTKKIYDNIVLDCEVQLSTSYARVVPIDLIEK